MNIYLSSFSSTFAHYQRYTSTTPIQPTICNGAPSYRKVPVTFTLIQRQTSGEVDRVVHRVHILHRLGHLLPSLLEIGSGSVHGEGELGTGIGEREGCEFWRGEDVEQFWHVGYLEPENLTIGVTVGLDQELRRTGLCSTRSVYPSRNPIPERENAPFSEESQT